MFELGNKLRKKVNILSPHKTNAGFSLVEIIIGTAVFMIISLSVYQSYAGLLNLVRVSRVKVTATNLANEQFEIARNLPYGSVGLVAGIPSGVIPPVQNLVRDGISFVVTTTIRNEDDPFDGLACSNPPSCTISTDSAPADFKSLQINVGCPSCKNYIPVVVSGRVAPKNLEAATNNGSLFVKTFDANGLPISGARVQVVNNSVVPIINIDTTSNAQGMLQLVDVPPSVDSYEVIVSKPSYSTDRTYSPGGPEVEVPDKPHATIAAQTVTQASFAIDQTGAIVLSTVRDTCTPVPGVTFNIAGTKSIGTTAGNPVLKYSASETTDVSGDKNLSSMEWDTYSISLNDATYDLAGTISPLPVVLAPGSSQNVTLVVAPKSPNSLLVTVKDAVTQLPITDASVNLTDGVGYNETKITGRGFLGQTDWSGGGGQANFVDPTLFFSTDGNIEYTVPGGELRLKEIFGLFQTSGNIVSSTFDTGSASNFYQMLWSPTNQPPQTGDPNVRLQFATNSTNDGSETWDFKGPDGTAGTFFTVGNQNINASHNGSRYARYKVLLNSASDLSTPSISDVQFTFTSSCVPPGQVIFTNLSAGTYALTVSKTGYQLYTNNVNVNTSWQNHDVNFLSE